MGLNFRTGWVITRRERPVHPSRRFRCLTTVLYPVISRVFLLLTPIRKIRSACSSPLSVRRVWMIQLDIDHGGRPELLAPRLHHPLPRKSWCRSPDLELCLHPGAEPYEESSMAVGLSISLESIPSIISFPFRNFEIDGMNSEARQLLPVLHLFGCSALHHLLLTSRVITRSGTICSRREACVPSKLILAAGADVKPGRKLTPEPSIRLLRWI